MLRVAAVALVQADDVHAAGEGFRRQPAHVVRLARPVQAVQRQQREMFPGTRLPVTGGHHARGGGDVEVAARGGRQARKVTRVAPAVEGHAMAAAQRRPRLEPIRHRTPPPRRSSTIWSAAKSPNCSTVASGHRTVTPRTPVSLPNPTWTRGSLLAR